MGALAGIVLSLFCLINCTNGVSLIQDNGRTDGHVTCISSLYVQCFGYFDAFCFCTANRRCAETSLKAYEGDITKRVRLAISRDVLELSTLIVDTRTPPGKQSSSGCARALCGEEEGSGSATEPRSDVSVPSGGDLLRNTESNATPCDVTTGSLLIGGAVFGFVLLAVAIGVRYILQKRKLTGPGIMQDNKRCKVTNDPTEAGTTIGTMHYSNLYSDPDDHSSNLMATNDTTGAHLSPPHGSNTDLRDSHDYIHMYARSSKGIKGLPAPPGGIYSNYQSDPQEENVYVIPDADYS